MSELDGTTLGELSQEELEAKMKEAAVPVIPQEAPRESEQAEKGQPEAKEEEVETKESAPEAEAAEQAQEEVTEEPKQEESALPEKYRGKSIEELAKILQDQESYIGKLGNERSTTKREMDELRDRLDNLDKPQSQNSPDVKQELRQGLEEDPAEALINYIDNAVGSVKSDQQKQLQKQQETEFIDFYNNKVNSDPDFLRRREALDAVADEVKSFFKPEMVKSKAFIEIVDLVSQGLDKEYYVNEALKSQLKTKETALEEKRKSKTESSFSQGAASVPSNPNEMTQEELEQALMSLRKQ